MKDTNKEEEQHQKSKIIDVKESIEGKQVMGLEFRDNGAQITVACDIVLMTAIFENKVKDIATREELDELKEVLTEVALGDDADKKFLSTIRSLNGKSFKVTVLEEDKSIVTTVDSSDRNKEKALLTIYTTAVFHLAKSLSERYEGQDFGLCTLNHAIQSVYLGESQECT